MNSYYHLYFKFIGLAAAAALASVYIAEYVFGILPCKLCYYQRWIFISILFLCMTALHAKFPKELGVKIATILLFVSICVSVTHLGIENGWWKLDLSCTGNLHSKTDDIAEFKAMIMSKDDIPCDVVSFSFMGLTLAGWNFIYSSLLFMLSLTLMFVFMGTPRYEKNKK